MKQYQLPTLIILILFPFFAPAQTTITYRGCPEELDVELIFTRNDAFDVDGRFGYSAEYTDAGISLYVTWRNDRWEILGDNHIEPIYTLYHSDELSSPRPPSLSNGHWQANTEICPELIRFDGDGASTLPVTLVSYNLLQQANGTVKINWQTAAESNNKYFIIERSGDAKNYIQIGRIESKVSVGNINYTFVDEEPLFGNNYYRLNQYDIDGRSKELGIKTLTLSKGQLQEVTIYPNPVIHDKFSLNMGMPIQTSLQYKIVDLSGRVFLIGLIKNYRQDLDVSKLAKGFYLLKVADRRVIKFIKY